MFLKRLKEMTPSINMENNSDIAWQALVEQLLEQRRADIDIAIREQIKRTTVWARCSLCKGCVNVWGEHDDKKYCRSCYKLRFDTCLRCSGCLDFWTLGRGDNICSECYLFEHGTYHTISPETVSTTSFS